MTRTRACPTPAARCSSPTARPSRSPACSPARRCGDDRRPRVFTRLGEGELNTWVHDRTPEANFDFESGTQPQATVPFALIATPDHPEGDDYFTEFKWDLDERRRLRRRLRQADRDDGRRARRGGRRDRGVQAGPAATRATPRRPTSPSTCSTRRPRPAGAAGRAGRRDPHADRATRSRAHRWPPSSSPAARRCAAGASRSASASRRPRRAAPR